MFQKYGASAIAANTFLRSTLAAIFPLFIDSMYAKLGNRWATSIVGFFATLLITIPFVFWKYGPAIRRSKNMLQTKDRKLLVGIHHDKEKVKAERERWEAEKMVQRSPVSV